jgi:uncharacterized protein (DUF433 family)
MKKIYVERRDGGYWIKGSRISLDSVVYAFKRGTSPETIKRNFPLLTLEEIYGAITFYLANEKKIDAYLEETEKQFEEAEKARREQLHNTKPGLMKRLKKARQGSEVAR